MSYTLAYTGAEIDALLGKIDAIFVAEYGSTIYSEVTAAIAAGNKVIVANAGKVYVYAGQDDNGGYVFTQSGPNAAKPNATYVTLSTGNVWSTATVDLATLQQFYASLMEDTLEDTEIASFPDGANDVPVESLVVKIEAMQAGSGDPAPDNIRPIYSNAEKNILPMTLANIKAINTTGTWNGNAYTRGGVTFTVNVNSENAVTSITVNGSNSAVVALALAVNFALESGVSYTINGAPTVSESGAYLRVIGKVNDTGSGATFTSTGTESCDIVVNANATISDAVFYPMLRSADNPDPTFVPYRCVARVDVEGKNLLGKFVQGYLSTTDGKSASYNANWVYTPDYIKIAGGTTIRVSATRTNSSVLFTYDKNMNFLGAYQLMTSATVGGKTLDANVAFLRFAINIAGGSIPITPAEVPNYKFQLEIGTEATEYEDPKDRTYFSLAKNIWDEEWESGGYSNETGAKVEDTDAIRSKNPISVKPNTNYYYKSTVGVRLFYYDADLNYISTEVAINTTKTTPANAYFVNFRTGSSAVPVTTYNGDIAILTAPPEIWGGELNVTTGELKVTDAGLDIGTLAWNYNSTYQAFACNNPAGLKGVADNVVANALCSIYAVHKQDLANTADKIFWINPYGNVWVRDTAYTDAVTFKTAVTGQTLVAELATPLIFHLDPVEIKTWLANNNIICNTGKIKLLVYRCNTALYIQKMLGGNVQTLGMSPLSIRRPVSISQEDIDQAGEMSDAFTEALDFEPYDEPEAEEPEELTEEPEAEEEPAEDAEAEEEPEAPEEVR